MYELERLECAITQLSTCPKWQRRVLQKEILLRGSRVYRWTKETYALLDKQLAWLDSHENAPTYEQRFAEWVDLLNDYTRGCDALNAAEALRIGVAA